MLQKIKFNHRVIRFRQWSNKRYGAFNSLHKVIKICTLAIAYSLVSKPAPVVAKGIDTTSTRITELDEVTIQSTLIEMKSAETGRSIDIINGSQIQTLPVTSLDELLRYVPGVDVQQRGAFGAQADFSIRGSNFNQVLVLIDGQKINDPITAHFNSNIPVSPAEIERIEVIHGPASLEYGPDATGGVINIITKTFSKNKYPDGIHANVKFHYGNYNLISTSNGVFYGSNNLKLSGGILNNSSDGNTLKSGLKNYFDIRSASFSEQLQMNRFWSVSYRFASDYRDFNAQWFYTDYATDKAIEKVKRNRHQCLLSRSTENSTSQIKASYISTNDYYLYSPTSSPNDNSSGDFNMQFLQSTNLSSSFKNSIGFNFDRRTVLSSNRGNHALNHYAVHTTILYKPLDKLTFNAGLREDFDQNYGYCFLPQVSGSYLITKRILVRAAWGRSVRAADFTENYNDNYKKDTLKSSPGIGNRNLVPEKSTSAEIGFDFKFFSGTLLSITGFNRDASDIIDYVKYPGYKINIDGLKLLPNTLYWYAQNNSNTKNYGLETRISMSKSINNTFIKFTCGYTFLRIDTGYNKTAKYALLQPKHMVNWMITVENGPIIWNIDGLNKSRNKHFSKNLNTYLKDSYSVWNTSLDIAVYKRAVYLSLVAFNIFDKKYSDFFGAEMPGRWLAGGLRINF
jgi:vitamin B12 transporter